MVKFEVGKSYSTQGHAPNTFITMNVLGRSEKTIKVKINDVVKKIYIFDFCEIEKAHVSSLRVVFGAENPTA